MKIGCEIWRLIGCCRLDTGVVKESIENQNTLYIFFQRIIVK